MRPPVEKLPESSAAIEVLSEIFFHSGHYLFVCVVVGRFQGAYGCAEDFGHVFIFHFIEITHIEDDSLFARERGDGLVEFSCNGIPVEIRVSLYFRSGNGGIGFE